MEERNLGKSPFQALLERKIPLPDTKLSTTDRYQTAIETCGGDHTLMNYVLNCGIKDAALHPLGYECIIKMARKAGFVFATHWELLNEEPLFMMI